MATQKITGNGSKESLGGRKLRLDLIPPQTLKAIAQVLGFGAAKYDAHNWMRGLPWMELAAGVKRHLGAFEVGEEIDPESGCPTWLTRSVASCSYTTKLTDPTTGSI